MKRDRMKSSSAKLGLWLMLCLVATALWLIGCGVIAGVASPWLDRGIPSRERETELLTFDSDGNPIISGIDPGPGVRQRHYRNLEGEQLDLPETKLPSFAKFSTHDLPSLDFPVRVDLNTYDTPALPWSFFSDPLPWDVRLQHTTAHNGRDSTTWVFVSPDRPQGHGYFVVWNDTRSERIGYLGLNGLTQTIPPTEQQFPAFGRTFDEMLRFPYANFSRIKNIIQNHSSFAGWSMFAISPADDRLFHIKLLGNTVQTVWSGRPGSLRDVLFGSAPVERAGTEKDQEAPREAAMFLVLADEIQQLNEEFQLVRHIRLPRELHANRNQLLWAEPRPGEHVVVVYDEGWQQSRRQTRVFWFNDAGEVSQRREVSLQWGRPRVRIEREARLSVAACFSPLVCVGMFLEATHDLRRNSHLGIVPGSSFIHFTDGMGQAFAVVWLSLAFVLLASLGLVVASQRRLRRIGASRFDRVTWAVLILLFGGAGYWAFRVHRRWPIHAACPTCGHDVPRDRGECLACSAEFAAPARNGCELFA
jgi:hypothetical protein